MFDENTDSFTISRGPRPGPPSRPPYLSNYVAAGPGIKLNNHGSADTPRNRFDYSVELRQYQQKQEWLASQIEQSMFGDTESQNKVARKWVVDQWQRWGIWNRGWPEDGPESEEPWGDGHPACLLAMELTWEIEHIVAIRQPVDVSKICDTKAPHGSDTPPLNWSWEIVAALAAERLFSRHSQNGFPSTKIEMPSVVFRRDLKSLSANLSEPVQKLVATVKDWDDLSLSLETQVERRVIFGKPIGITHSKASTLEAGGARKPDTEDGRGLFGMSHRETSTLEDGTARNSGYETIRPCENNAENFRRLFGVSQREAGTSEVGGSRKSNNQFGRGLFGMSQQEASTSEVGGSRKSDNQFGQGLFGMSQQEASTSKAGGARNPAYVTIRPCENTVENHRRIFGTDWQTSTLEADGARNSANEQGRDLTGTTYREASPSIFLTESGRVFFSISDREEENKETQSALRNFGYVVNGRMLADLKTANNEEAVRTSGRQVEEAQKSEAAELAASIRAIRGPRRRELHRKPGERTVRLTQGGRIKKASKQARP